MHFALPTSGHDSPCAAPKFTAITAVTAQPAYAVYVVCYQFKDLLKKINRVRCMVRGSFRVRELG